MTLETAAVLVILGISLYPFVSEKLRMDVLALLVLGALASPPLWGVRCGALRGQANPGFITGSETAASAGTRRQIDM